MMLCRAIQRALKAFVDFVKRTGGMSQLGHALVDVAWNACEEVELPRTVTVRNFRLGFTLRVMETAALVFVVWLLASSQSWIRVEAPIEMGVINAFDITNATTYLEESKVDFDGLCADTEVLDYWYDDEWTYTNYSCTMPAAKSERFWKEGDRLLYVPTA